MPTPVAVAPEKPAKLSLMPNATADSLPGQETDDAKLDSTSAPLVGQAEVVAGVFAEVLQDSSAKALDYVRGVPASWLEAGAAWLATGGWKPEMGNVVPTLGVNAAIQGIIAAAKETNIGVPLVVRLEGTNVERGKELLSNSGLDIIPADDLDDAAKKAVAAIGAA